MATFSDLIHDIGGEYTQFEMGCADSQDDIVFLLKAGNLKDSGTKLAERISYWQSVLKRIKECRVCISGLIEMLRPVIDERVGANCEFYLLELHNDLLVAMADNTLRLLRMANLNDLTEVQLIEFVKTVDKNFEGIRGKVKHAMDIFFAEKPKLYEKIDKTTEIDFGNNFRVLLLDDEKDICLYIKNFLSKKKFNVETAIDAAKAKELTNTFKPQIAILDFKLDSEETGMDVLKFIKANQPACRCLMFTFVDDKEFIQKCKDLGAMGMLVKPVVVDVMKRELYKAVKEIMHDA